MEFKLGETRYTFSFGFFTVVAVYMLLDRTGAALPALAAIILHECGHILVMRLTGAQISAMRFCAFGVRLEKSGLLSYGREIAVYLGGVIANAIAITCCVPFFGWNLFALVNAALLLFNLLPVGRLDGGRLIYLLLCRRENPTQADTVQRILGFFILTPMFAAAFWLLPRGNYTMLITALYLALTLLRA